MTPEETEARAIGGLDPWGLRRIEKLLVGLDGVASLKIVPDGRGGIEEIHVLSTSELGAKRIVRNIESALLAEFGLQIDHRKISVARVREAEVQTAAEPVRSAQTSDRLLLGGVHIERVAGKQVRCRVELGRGEAVYAGEAVGPDFEAARMEAAAAAVLEALRQATGEDVTLTLQGVARTLALGSDFVIVVVTGSERRVPASLSGVAIVHDSAEEAAVRACLLATNRWMGAR